MKLLQLIRASIYSPAFYRGLERKPFWFSIKYFYSLTLVIGIVFSVTFSLRAIPAIHTFVQGVSGGLVSLFPENLEITIRSGTASINQPEPYFIPFPDALRETMKSTDGAQLKNLLVVNTRDAFSIDQFRSYETAILITRESVVWSDREGRISIDTLAAFPDTLIDRPFLIRVSNQIELLGRWLAPVIVFGSFVAFIIGYSFHLLYFVPIALIAWVITRMRKHPVSYRTSYQMAIHAFTLSALAEMIITDAFRVPTVQYLPTFIVIVTLWANLRWMESEPRSSVPPAVA